MWHALYTSALFVAGLEDLDSRRDLLSHNFLFYYRHLVYIVYFRHLAILNYCLALGLPPNILEFQIELKKYQPYISYALAHYQ